LTQTWAWNPQFKLECSGETYINDQCLSILNPRPENNIAHLIIKVSDYKSSKYVDVFDAFDAIDLSLSDDGGTSWSKVFSGTVTTVAPRRSIPEGEILEVGCWGKGIAAWRTHCDESYGLESIDNSAVDTPKEIIEDIIDEHINKIFGAAAGSNWSLTKKVDNAHAGLSVTYLNSQYDNNFVNINRVCDLTNAYAQGLGAPEVSVHWFTDPSGNLYFKKIDADHTDGNWDRYWGGTSATDPGTQASSTIVVKEDMILYNFRKNVEEYANHIVLSSKFRRPAEDLWCEDHGTANDGASLWEGDGKVDISDSDTSIVGSKSILLEPNDGGAAGSAWFPKGKAGAWNFDAFGSINTIPTLNMWMRRNEDIGLTGMDLYTSAGNWFTLYTGLNNYIPSTDEWCYLSFPVGSYHAVQDEYSKKRWYVGGGAPDWTDINWIQFDMVADVSDDLYIDDMHFSGIIVREAKDTSEIADHNTYMKVIRNDTAVNDTLVASDDSGTAARLAYAELLRRSQTPIVGVIRIPLALDILPGQTVHIHACEKSDGSYRIDQDFRVKEPTHYIGQGARYGGFETQLNLTSDVTNTHAFGAPSAYALLKQYAGALGHSEARNLKGGDLDNLIPRLSKSY